MIDNPPKPVRMVVDSSVLLPILASPERDDNWLVRLWDEGIATPLVKRRNDRGDKKKTPRVEPNPEAAPSSTICPDVPQAL